MVTSTEASMLSAPAGSFDTAERANGLSYAGRNRHTLPTQDSCIPVPKAVNLQHVLINENARSARMLRHAVPCAAGHAFPTCSLAR